MSVHLQESQQRILNFIFRKTFLDEKSRAAARSRAAAAFTKTFPEFEKDAISKYISIHFEPIYVQPNDSLFVDQILEIGISEYAKANDLSVEAVLMRIKKLHNKLNTLRKLGIYNPK